MKQQHLPQLLLLTMQHLPLQLQIQLLLLLLLLLLTGAAVVCRSSSPPPPSPPRKRTASPAPSPAPAATAEPTIPEGRSSHERAAKRHRPSSPAAAQAGQAPAGHLAAFASPPTTPVAHRQRASSPIVPGSQRWVSLGRPAGDLPSAIRPNEDIAEVWQVLNERERQYLVNPVYLERHPQITPRMRALVLDWLIEICEEFLMHRETYYMALSYFDRFLSTATNIPKTSVQLIGTTCIFIAAKLQEIYPPSIEQFADLSDGACSEADIVRMELTITQALDWKLTPVTPIAWLKFYLQAASRDAVSDEFLCVSGLDASMHDVFYRATQLLDLASLEYSSSRFSPSVLAAAVLVHMQEARFRDLQHITGFSLAELQPCYDWLEVFSQTLVGKFRRTEFDAASNISPRDAPFIQTHVTTFDVYKHACHALQEREHQQQLSIVGLTPPRSDVKLQPPASSA
eukprot:m.170969 g.170969  ORF g.170969 m.170969 type:complete len:456 (+) comp10382_c4_seq1:245-1612(+)